MAVSNTFHAQSDSQAQITQKPKEVMVFRAQSDSQTQVMMFCGLSYSYGYDGARQISQVMAERRIGNTLMRARIGKAFTLSLSLQRTNRYNRSTPIEIGPAYGTAANHGSRGGLLPAPRITPRGTKCT